MAKRVFILGAGASASCGAPLMLDFLDKAFDLRDTHKSSIPVTEFELAFDVVRNRLPTLYARSHIDLHNIETVLGLVEMGLLVQSLPGTPKDEIETAASSIRALMASTVECLCQFPLDDGYALPPSDYARFVEWIYGLHRQPSDNAILTFNYDVALDVALSHLEVPFDYCQQDRVASGATPVLKLHGSLNWTQCSACRELVATDLRALLSSRRGRLRGSTSTSIFPTKTFANLAPHCADGTYDKHPALVPPAWNKSQYHAIFSRIWQRAVVELTDAREIVVIGYSLPETDAFFRDLLALGLAESRDLRSFTVVNPDMQVISRFEHLLGPATSKRFTPKHMKFNEYLDDAAGASPQIHVLG